MKFFEKRIKPVENITFISILTAITVAFFAILNFVPYSFIIVVLLFPFLSFIAGYLCKKRYFILYLLATILLCCTFAFYDLSNLLFYLVPSLIAGFAMSVLAAKKVSIYFQILISAIIIFIFTLISIPFIQIIYEINLIKDLLKILNLNEYKYINSFVYSSLLFISFLQSIFSYILIYLLSPRFKIEIIKKDKKHYFHGGFAVFFGVACFILSFTKLIPELNFILLLVAFYFLIICLADFKYKSKFEIAVLAASFIITVITYVLLYNEVPAPNSPCLFSILPILYGIYFSINRGIFSK